jgi:hypothetical protein
LLSDWMQRGQVDLPEMGQEILQREGECWDKPWDSGKHRLV